MRARHQRTGTHVPTTRLEPAGGSAPERIAGELNDLRTELGELVGELDRRRQEVFDLRVQLRRHPVVFVLAAGVVGWAVWATLSRHAQRRKRLRSPVVRLRNVGRALARASADPEHLSHDGYTGSARYAKPVGAALGSLGAVAARALIDTTLHGGQSRRRRR